MDDKKIITGQLQPPHSGWFAYRVGENERPEAGVGQTEAEAIANLPGAPDNSMADEHQNPIDALMEYSMKHAIAAGLPDIPATREQARLEILDMFYVLEEAGYRIVKVGEIGTGRQRRVMRAACRSGNLDMMDEAYIAAIAAAPTWGDEDATSNPEQPE